MPPPPRMRIHAQLLKDVSAAVSAQLNVLAAGAETVRGSAGLRALKRLVASVAVAVCHGLKVCLRFFRDGPSLNLCLAAGRSESVVGLGAPHTGRDSGATGNDSSQSSAYVLALLITTVERA